MVLTPTTLVRQLLQYKAYRDAADAPEKRREEWEQRFPLGRAGVERPDWFCDTIEMFNVYLNPEQARLVTGGLFYLFGWIVVVLAGNVMAEHAVLDAWKHFACVLGRKLNGEAVHVINLYPKVPSKAEYHTIILYISKAGNELVKASMKAKDGTVMTYVVTKFTANPEIDDTKFVFDKKKFPGYPVIKD